MSTRDICVIGAGGWGTAVALVLVEKGHRVRMWGHDQGGIEAMRRARENTRFLAGVPLPEALELHHEAEAAVSGAEVIVNGVPTAFLEPVMTRFIGLITKRAPIVSLTKGIDVESLERPSQTLRRLYPGHAVAVLSGPSHAEEVAMRIPSSVVMAASQADLAAELQNAFMTERFRVYSNTDLIGVELGGALKNVIALAAGASDGLGFGDNTKAALVTRGLVEMSRLATALGAKKQTFAGLAGMGDLITTAFSPHGRNRAVGERIGRGVSLERILRETEKVAEGVGTSKAVRLLAEREKIEMPIASEVHAMLFEGKDAAAALDDLMRRDAKPEQA